MELAIILNMKVIACLRVRGWGMGGNYIGIAWVFLVDCYLGGLEGESE